MTELALFAFLIVYLALSSLWRLMQIFDWCAKSWREYREGAWGVNAGSRR